LKERKNNSQFSVTASYMRRVIVLEFASPPTNRTSVSSGSGIDVIPGKSAAALRYRAHRQKLELRALHAAAPHSAAMSAFPRVAPATVWTPLGTAPLASDASGLGVQDYGPVAGRATAVAIDPADASGNTLI
jgi:hypothetical protein